MDLAAASRGLGFVDPRAPSVAAAVAGRDVTVHKSPAVLASSRPGGTTGAVLWKVTPRLASWLAASGNPLLALLLPSPASSVIEIGCGISPLNALALRRRVAHYVLSDPRLHKGRDEGLVDDAAAAAPRRSFDAVLSCDCVFNEALVAPLVQTCVDVCGLRRQRRGAAGRYADSDHGSGAPCVCIVAQQLRSDDVFHAWLAAFHAAFRVWRVPPDMLPPDLRPSAGYAIHVGILRGYDDGQMKRRKRLRGSSHALESIAPPHLSS